MVSQPLQTDAIFSIMPTNPKQKLSPEHKVITLGASGVGKTRLIRRMATGVDCHDISSSGFGGDFLIKMAQIDQRVVKLQLWDTAGQERFGVSMLPRSYFRYAQGAFLVYDVMNRRSFQEMLTWITLLHSYHNNSNFTVVLIAHKCDVAPHERQVSTQEGQRLAKYLHADYFECSSREATNVETCFETIAKNITTIESNWSVDLNQIASAIKEPCQFSSPVTQLAETPKKTPMAVVTPALTVQVPLPSLSSNISKHHVTSPTVYALYQDSSSSWSTLFSIHSIRRMMLVGTFTVLMASPLYLQCTVDHALASGVDFGMIEA